MELTSVTLDEVFAAAQARAASLVPETSGYLALAVADASARLPFSIDDPMVMLTSEGTVKVARGSEVITPDESARRMRGLLARLLECSAGSMPALAATARARNETPDGVDGFIRELEAALVPVNRAAARRALARLARETVRAKDSGRLRRRRRPAPAPPAAPPAPPVPAPAARAAEPVAEVEVVFSPPPAPVVAPQAAEPQPPQPFEMEAVAAPEPTPTPEEPPTVIDTEVALIDAQASAPVEPPPAPTADPDAAPRRASTAGATAALGGTQKSDVEDLLERFVVSTLSSPESMRQARASLKRLAGLDPTPPPPPVEEIRRLTAAIESSVRARRAEAPEAPAVVPPPSRGAFRASYVAVAVIALLVAGLLGHYLPRLLAAGGGPEHALTGAASR